MALFKNNGRTIDPKVLKDAYTCPKPVRSRAALAAFYAENADKPFPFKGEIEEKLLALIKQLNEEIMECKKRMFDNVCAVLKEAGMDVPSGSYFHSEPIPPPIIFNISDGHVGKAIGMDVTSGSFFRSEPLAPPTIFGGHVGEPGQPKMFDAKTHLQVTPNN